MCSKHRAPPAQGASLREYGKAWLNEGLLQALPFQGPDGDALPVSGTVLPGGAGVTLGIHTQPPVAKALSYVVSF